MRRYWSQAMMLLLGISLTVGFYEGRRLVKNTAKALTAATTITSSKRDKRHRDDRNKEDPGISAEEDDLLGVALPEDDEELRMKRRKEKLNARALMLDPNLSKAEKINLMRMRQRQKLLGRGGPPGALPEIPIPGKPPMPGDGLLDTGIKQVQRAPGIE